MRLNAGGYDEGRANNQSPDDYPEGNAVGGYFHGNVVILQSAMLQFDGQIIVFQPSDETVQFCRQILQTGEGAADQFATAPQQGARIVYLAE